MPFSSLMKLPLVAICLSMFSALIAPAFSQEPDKNAEALNSLRATVEKQGQQIDALREEIAKLTAAVQSANPQATPAAKTDQPVESPGPSVEKAIAVTPSPTPPANSHVVSKGET